MKTTSLQQKYRDTMSGVTGNEFIHFQNKHFISEVKSKERDTQNNIISSIHNLQHICTNIELTYTLEHINLSLFPFLSANLSQICLLVITVNDCK